MALRTLDSFDGGGVLNLVGNDAGLLIGPDASIDLGAMGFTGSGVLSSQGIVNGQMASLPGDFINLAGATANLTDVVIGGSLFNYGHFNTGGVERVDGTQIRQLGGVLSLPGTANLDMTHPANLFSWQNGTIGGTGALGFSGGGNFLFAGNGDRVIDGLNFAFNHLVLPDGSLTLQSGSLTLSGTTVLPAGVSLNLVGGTLANNGSLDIAGSFSLTGGAFGGTGSLTLSGGLLSLPTGNSVAWTNSGALTNTGTLNLAGSTITNAINNQGTLNLGAGLTFTQAVLNTGTVSAQAGTAVFAGGLTQDSNSSAIVLAGGNLQGDLNLHAGTIMGTGTVNGNLVVGAARIAPGASPGAITITGNLSLDPASVMHLEIAGLAPGTGYDFVHVLGNANLAGTLNVSTLGGFVAPAGSNFAVMLYASSNGAFSTVNLPASVRAFTFFSGPTGLTLSAAADVVPMFFNPSANPITTALERLLAPDDAFWLMQGFVRIEPEDAREIEMEG